MAIAEGSQEIKCFATNTKHTDEHSYSAQSRPSINKQGFVLFKPTTMGPVSFSGKSAAKLNLQSLSFPAHITFN